MVKVTICGAAGGIGQPLSLLMKQSNDIDHLSLFDIANAKGVASDISHINTHSKVTGHNGPQEVKEALENSDIVLVSAGVPRKPGMERDDLFKVNAGIVRDICTSIATYSPNALVCIISNPVNATVVVASEVFKKYGVYNPRKIFGVNTLDLIRSSSFLAELIHADPASIEVPVIGGHNGTTIIPIFSQVESAKKLSEEEIAQITKRVQYAGDEVLKAKEGKGTATLAMAHAGARFALKLVDAVANNVTHTECSYISLLADPEGSKEMERIYGQIGYFAVPIELGKEGIKRIIPIKNISTVEFTMLHHAVIELKASIAQGVQFSEDQQ
ncbi:hypothetical protein INT47_011856 [Mucor saturninus]|uniref:malate dehydrogenase n=1 Tax=Mucor saturninus TaxID=64648 RepID=A0A8H7RDQ5_9FUNG|nr:hypothetical protein INT47_011856 [Mucor saturninus]